MRLKELYTKMLIIMNKTIIRMRAVGALETVPLRLTFNFKQIGLDVPEICTVGNCLDTEKTTEVSPCNFFSIKTNV